MAGRWGVVGVGKKIYLPAKSYYTYYNLYTFLESVGFFHDNETKIDGII